MAKQTKEKNMRYHFVFLKKTKNISRGKDYFTTSLSKAVKCFENDEENKRFSIPCYVWNRNY